MPAVAGALIERSPAVARSAEQHITPAAARRESPDLAPVGAGIAFLVGLALYATTAAPGVQGGDSGEFQFVAYIMGIPHPPGYPLYAVVGKLWTLVVPIGEVAYRMNLLSVAFAAGTLGATAWAMAKTVGRGWPGLAAGLVAAGWLAVAPTWWGQATIASVRPPTGFFLAATLATLASFAASRRPRALYVAAAIFGLGLTHHISLYTLGPALAVFVLVCWPGVLRRRDVLTRTALAGSAPLLLYLYLPIRSAIGTPFDASHPTTPRAFFDLITARGFAGDMLQYSPLAPERLELGRQIALTNFGALGIALALGGLGVTVVSRPRWALLLLAIAASNLAIGLSYRAPVIADYLIPTYLTMAMGIGMLAVAPAVLLCRLWAGPAAVLALIGGALALWVPVAYGGAHWGAFNLSADRADERVLRDAFARAEPGATILTDWYHATVLWYGQYARGERLDLTVEYVSPEGEEVSWARRAEAALERGPVYATALDRRVGERYRVQRVGALYAVRQDVPRELPPGLTASGIVYGEAIELAGYRLLEPSGGADIAIEMAWRARAAPGRDYSQFLHLTDPSGRVWGQRDGTPGEGVRPTGRWQAGEVIVERYELTAALGAEAGTYGIRVGFYESLPGGGWRRLQARDDGGGGLGDAPTIATVALAPRQAPPPFVPTPPTNVVERALGRAERTIRGNGPLPGIPPWALQDMGGSMWC